MNQSPFDLLDIFTVSPHFKHQIVFSSMFQIATRRGNMLPRADELAREIQNKYHRSE